VTDYSGASGLTAPDIALLNFALQLECLGKQHFSSSRHPAFSICSATEHLLTCFSALSAFCTQPESNFYAIVAESSLSSSLTMSGDGTRGPGTVTGEQNDNVYSNKIYYLANELYNNEKAHLTLLRETLKSDGGGCQNIALGKEVFQNVLTAAAIPGLSAPAIEAFE
jgi:hypothetical protein